MKIGFIGLGNMAAAIIGGLLESGIATPADIVGSAKTPETRARMQERFGIDASLSNVEVANAADVLILAVKPVFFPQVIDEIATSTASDKLVVSIAAGLTCQRIEELFGHPVRLVRCMPNTPALVGAGCTAVCAGPNAQPDDEALCLQLMGSFGRAIAIPERLMDAEGAVGGSSPAFAFMFVEALADGAVAAGMPRAQAYEFAAQSLLGSAKLVLESGKHPGELKDMVCSPGGTTIEGVRVLEEAGFRGAIMDAIDACVQKSKQL